MLEFGVVSHLSATVVYSLLAGFTAARYLRRNTDRAILLASLVTAGYYVQLGVANFAA